MIEGLHQRHYKNAIVSILESWSGEAYGREVIDAMMNGPDEFRIGLTEEEKARTDPYGDNTFEHACLAAVEQLRKDGYVESLILINGGFGHGRRSLIYLQNTNAGRNPFLHK